MAPSSRKTRGPGKPRGIRHDRDCSTCKLRGVKCDLNRPSCGPCQHNGISCGGYTQRVIWAASHSTQKPHPGTRDKQRPSAAPERMQRQLPGSNVLCRTVKSPNISANDANWTTHYVNYLEYFRQKVGQSQQVKQSGIEALGMVNSVDPLSSVWKFALKRMSGLGSRPWALSIGEVTDVDEILSHTTAVAALRHAVERSGIKAIFGIATFAFIDVYKGPFGAWQQHLKGARAVLDSYGMTEEQLAALCSQTSGLREIVSLLCWYDVSGLVIRQDRGLIFEDHHRRLMDDSIFDLIGCPKETFVLLTAIAKLGFPHIIREPSLYFSAANQLMRVSNGTQTHAHLLSDAWRHAAVLAVFERESVVRMDNESIVKRQSIDRICQILEAIPPQSAKYRHLPFAAFMAGRHAQLPRHTRAVIAYWRTCISFQDSIYPDGERISQVI
ncbi:hypothetical protein N7540_002677 [Penicillium herquei]|nr:hypothetical protein N7540_002677 [Penicillium herquei]